MNTVQQRLHRKTFDALKHDVPCITTQVYDPIVDQVRTRKWTRKELATYLRWRRACAQAPTKKVNGYTVVSPKHHAIILQLRQILIGQFGWTKHHFDCEYTITKEYTE